MTTCWLYGYIISSILHSIYERERREMASLNMLLSYHQRHQWGNDKYCTTVSRTTASTALLFVVEHKGKRLLTH